MVVAGAGVDRQVEWTGVVQSKRVAAAAAVYVQAVQVAVDVIDRRGRQSREDAGAEGRGPGGGVVAVIHDQGGVGEGVKHGHFPANAGQRAAGGRGQAADRHRVGAVLAVDLQPSRGALHVYLVDAAAAVQQRGRGVGAGDS